MKIPFISNLLWNIKLLRELDTLPPDVSDFVRATLLGGVTQARALHAPADYTRMVQEYAGWAYACAQKTATTSAQVPLRLFRGVPANGKVRKRVRVRKVNKATKDRFFNDATLVHQMNKAVDIEEVLEHPWLDLQRTVNQDLNGFTLRQLTVLFKQVTGNAYWLVPKSPEGTPLGIWVLPSQFVSIIPSTKTFVAGYEYGIGQDKIVYEPQNIVHFKYPSPKSIYYGLGPMEAAFTAVTLNTDFDEFERSVLDNGAYIPQAFTTEQPVSKTILQRYRKDLMRIHGGHKQAGRFGILPPGIKLLPLAWNPKDINYAIGQKLTKEKIAGVFGVPLSKLTVENVNRANADAGNFSYMADTICPENTSNADVINQEIMPCYDEKLFVAHDNCIPEDKEFRLKQETARLGSGVIAINEVRELEGIEPIDGGDEPLLQGSLKPLSLIVDPPEPVVIQSLDNNNLVANESDIGNDDKGWLPCKRIVHTVDNCNCNAIIKRPTMAAESTIEIAVADWMRATRTIVTPFVNEITVGSANLLDNTIPWEEVTASGQLKLAPPIISVLDAGALQAQRAMPESLRFAWNMQSPEAINWAKRYTARRVTVITEQTRLAIRDTVAKRLSEGITPQSLAKDIRGLIGINNPQAVRLATFKDTLITEGNLSRTSINSAVSEFEKKLIRERADMIARTESAMAFSEGEIQSYGEAGVQMLEFSAADDADEECLIFHTRKYPITETRGIIPIHPNCRCDWLPVVEV